MTSSANNKYDPIVVVGPVVEVKATKMYALLNYDTNVEASTPYFIDLYCAYIFAQYRDNTTRSSSRRSKWNEKMKTVIHTRLGVSGKPKRHQQGDSLVIPLVKLEWISVRTARDMHLNLGTRHDDNAIRKSFDEVKSLRNNDPPHGSTESRIIRQLLRVERRSLQATAAQEDGGEITSRFGIIDHLKAILNWSIRRGIIVGRQYLLLMFCTAF